MTDRSITRSCSPQGAELVTRAITGIPIEQLTVEGQIVEVAAGVLVATDEHPAEIDLLTRAIAAAEEVGAFGKVGIYSYCRSIPNYFMGALTEAIADAQASIRTAELGWETFMPGARGMLAHALIERGDLAGAAEALEIDSERWGGRLDYEAFVPVARCRLAFVEGRLDDALALGEQASVVPKSIGLRGLLPPNWRVWLALTLSLLGRRDEARALAAELVAVGREWGAHWSIGGTLRVAGVVEGGSDGIDLLRESAGLLEKSPARLERATTLVELGSALRRGGHPRDAREVLTLAMDLAHELGALALRERAREELRAAGSRPRRYALTGIAALTPSEHRVARLAAEGRTNRQIAQALFVTPKAVEYHLANVYPKLGIGSRQQLVPALAEAPGGSRISG
jgi:DNA-binding CsgD family transcriptional regulator